MSISKFYLDGFFDIDEKRYCSYNVTFKRATPKSDYIRILRLCDKAPKTLKEIYPNAKSAPIADTVVSLAKQGYLQKCTRIKYACYRCNRNGPEFVGCRKVWYYTTDKGRELVDRVLSTSKSEKTEKKKTSKTKTAADSAWQDMFAESMEALASAMDAFSTAMKAYKSSLNS